MGWYSPFAEFFAHPVLALLASLLWKSTVLLVLCAAATLCFRGASASLRGWLWSICLWGLLLVPLAELAPKWRISLLPARPEAFTEREVSPAPAGEGAASAVDALPLPADGPGVFPRNSRTPAGTGQAARSGAAWRPWLPWLLGGLWVAGGSLGLLSWLLSWRAGRRLIGCGEEIPERMQEVLEEILPVARTLAWPRLLLTSGLDSPAVAGVFSPVILLPFHCRRWSRERLRLVLLHEFEHISRHDCLIQFGARLACCLYWPNPLVWKAYREMQREREKACDDAVLSNGVRPSLYAQSLLDVARILKGQKAVRSRHLPGTLIAMARESHLEDRLMAILDVTRTHTLLSRRARVASILLAGAALTGMGTLEFQLRAAPGETRSGVGPGLPRIPAASPFGVSSSPASASSASTPAAPASGSRVAKQTSPRSGFRPETQRAAGDRRVTSYSRQSDDGSVEMLFRNGRYRLEVEASGEVELSADDRSVVGLSPRGYFRIREFKPGEPVRRFEVTDRDGSGTNLDFRYSVNDEVRPYQEEGRRWLGEVLLEVVRRSGLAAAQRIERMLGQGGPEAVFNEIRKIPSDSVKVIYFSGLAEQANLNNGQWIDFFELAAREIQSDGDKTRLLISTLEAVSSRGETIHESWFDAVRSVSSDGDKSRALIAAVEQFNLDASLAPQFYRTAGTISSDGDKSRVLLRWVSRPDRPLGTLFFDVAGMISSDGDLTRVLLAAIRATGPGGDPGDSIRLLRAARSIDSDGDLSRLLIGALNSDLSEEALHELLATARTIDSDGDKARVLISMAGRQQLSGSLRDEFLQVADSIRSSSDRRRVMQRIQE